MMKDGAIGKSSNDMVTVSSFGSFHPSDFRKLGDVIQPRREKVSPSKFPKLPFIGLEHVEAHTMRLLGTVPAGAMRSSANRFYNGDVLCSRLRPYLNKVCRPNFDGLCSSEFIVLPKTAGIEPDYLRYRLNSHDFVSFTTHLNASEHGDRPRVDFDQLSSFELFLPSYLEQQRIVAAIETQFSRLDEAVANLKRVKANLKRYKAAVLKAAVEGKLTEEWRRTHPDVESADIFLKRVLLERKKKWEIDSPGKKYREPAAADNSNLSELPVGWVWSRTDQLFHYVTSGSRGWASYYSESGSAFLRMGNLDHDTVNLDLSDIQRVQPPKGSEGTRTRVLPDDILISITADVGMVGIVPTDFEEAYINLQFPVACYGVTLCANVGV